MIRKILLACTVTAAMCVGLPEDVKAQDPQFTQFYANPLYLNPAFAGSARCPRFVLNYRNQWPGITGTFVTYTASYDQYVKAVDGGIGLQLLYDQAGEGTLNTTRVSAQYAYQVNLSREFAIRAGAEVTYLQRSLDWSKLTFGDQIDSRRGFIFPTQDTQRGGKASAMDFSAGLLGYSDKVYFGAAVHHLTEPNESVIVGESALPRKFTAHAGAKFKIRDSKYSSNSSSFISPNILFQQQADFKQLLVGLYMTKGPIAGGVWYRNKDSFIVLAGVQTEMLRFGYSYDVTVSKLTTKTAGSHELSLTLQFDCRVPKRKFRTISCPSF
jgi:type IX secretion system PorP/SprF family membrane protein